MSIEDTKVVLNAIQIAYPYFHRNATKESMELTIDLWASTFVNIPKEIVLLAVKKLVGTNTFAPTPAEVRKEIDRIRCEAIELLMIGNISSEQAERLKAIADSCKSVDTKPSLLALVEGRQELEASDKQQGYLPTL